MNTLQMHPRLLNYSFTVTDKDIIYHCLGFAKNDTFIVFGGYQSTPTEFIIKSFKLTDVKFIGTLP